MGIVDLDLTVRVDGDASVVTAAGDIDIQTVPALTDALDEALGNRPGRVVVDLQQVGFLDSSGLGVLVGAQKRARAQNSAVVVVASADNVTKLFRITRLTEVFPIYASVEDAVTG